MACKTRPHAILANTVLQRSVFKLLRSETVPVNTKHWWASVADGGPTLIQHWVDVLCVWVESYTVLHKYAIFSPLYLYCKKMYLTTSMLRCVIVQLKNNKSTSDFMQFEYQVVFHVLASPSSWSQINVEVGFQSVSIWPAITHSRLYIETECLKCYSYLLRTFTLLEIFSWLFTFANLKNFSLLIFIFRTRINSVTYIINPHQ